MPVPLIWGLQVAFGLLAWSIFAVQYIWPAIRHRDRTEAVRPILMLHGFRYIGLAILIPGVAAPQIVTTQFARDLAYGDLIAATLALIALASLKTRFATPLIWIFNLWGIADLLNAFYQGSLISLPKTAGLLGADYFIPILPVPLLLVTHIIVFRVLTRRAAVGHPVGAAA